jgi:hypothetical protein
MKSTALINFRRQFPQYDKYTDSDILQAFRQNYPERKAMKDDEIVAGLENKYAVRPHALQAFDEAVGVKANPMTGVPVSQPQDRTTQLMQAINQPRQMVQAKQKPEVQPIGFSETIKEEFTDKLQEKVPLFGGIAASVKSIELMKAAQRLKKSQEGKYSYSDERKLKFDTDGQPYWEDAPSLEKDTKLIQEYTAKQQEEQERGRTFMGTVAQGVSQLPTFMAEIGLTGGTATAVREGIKKGAKKGLVRKVTAEVAGAATQAASGMSPRTIEKVVERRKDIEIGLRDDEKWIKSFAKGYGDQVIELASERAGGAISGGLTKIAKATPFGKKFIGELSKRWAEKTGNNASAFVRKVMDKGQYSDFIGELGEEELGRALRVATGVTDGKDLKERAMNAYDDWLYQLGVEATVLGVPGAAKAAATYGRRKPKTDIESEPETETDESQKRFKESIDYETVVKNATGLTPKQLRQAPKKTQQEIADFIDEQLEQDAGVRAINEFLEGEVATERAVRKSGELADKATKRIDERKGRYTGERKVIRDKQEIIADEINKIMKRAEQPKKTFKEMPIIGEKKKREKVSLKPEKPEVGKIEVAKEIQNKKTEDISNLLDKANEAKRKERGNLTINEKIAADQKAFQEKRKAEEVKQKTDKIEFYKTELKRDDLPQATRKRYERSLKNLESKEKLKEPTKKEPEMLTEEEYLNKKGASRQGIGEPALHKNIQEGRAKRQALKRISEEDKALIEKRDELRKEYQEKLKSGEIRKPTRKERLEKIAQGHSDLESTKAAKRLLAKKEQPTEQKNPYLTMPIERVQEDAKKGVKLAKEAVEKRKGEIEQKKPVSSKPEPTQGKKAEKVETELKPMSAKQRQALRTKQDSIIKIAEDKKLDLDTPITDGGPTVNQLRDRIWPKHEWALDNFIRENKEIEKVDTPTEAVQEIVDGKRESTIGTKEFKKRMIAELDKAIEKAKDFPELDELTPTKRWQKYQELKQNKEFDFITIEIPGDGKFKIPNVKQELELLKKKVHYLPLDKRKKLTGKQVPTEKTPEFMSRHERNKDVIKERKKNAQKEIIEEVSQIKAKKTLTKPQPKPKAEKEKAGEGRKIVEFTDKDQKTRIGEYVRTIRSGKKKGHVVVKYQGKNKTIEPGKVKKGLNDADLSVYALAISNPTTASEKMHNEIVSRIDSIQRKAANAVKTYVVRTVDELPDYIKNHYKKRYNEKTLKSIRGIYQPMKTQDDFVVIFTHNQKSVNTAAISWFHEQVGHGGIFKVYKNNLTEVFDYTINKVGIDNIRTVIQKRGYKDVDDYTLAKEYLARIAEKIAAKQELTLTEQSVWNRFIQWLQETLGIENRNDIDEFVINSYKYIFGLDVVGKKQFQQSEFGDASLSTFDKGNPRRIVNRDRSPIKIRGTDIEVTEQAAKVEEMYQQAEKELKDLRKLSWNRIKRGLRRAFVDMSGNVKAELLKRGQLGKDAVIRKDLVRGASTKAKEDIGAYTKQIYDGLNETEEAILNRIIQSRRTIVLDEEGKQIQQRLDGLKQQLASLNTRFKQVKSKTEAIKIEQARKKVRQSIEQTKKRLRLKHPFGLLAEDHKAYIASLPQELYQKLNKRADAYFKAMGEQLDDLHKNGLISDSLYETLKEKGDYSPRQFIQWIDPEENYSFGGKKMTITSSGIKALDEGSERVMELNSRSLLHQVVGRTQARIFKNKANVALYRLAKNEPANGVIKIFKGDKAPGGFEIVTALVDGEQVQMLMPNTMAKEWVVADPAINAQLANVLGWISGSKILRPMATGINPEFALTNFPRDIAHVWLTTGEYSSTSPIAALQMGKDFITTFKDAFGRGQRWKDFLQQGGGMDFLTHQGAITRKVHGFIGNIQTVMGYLGETSEIWTRLALRERALRNGKSETEATWIARNYLDFSQGGQITKAVDTVIPYLNAGIQGTRGIFRAAKQDPGVFTYKVAQLGVIATGVLLANLFKNRDQWDDIPERDKINNFIITTGMSYKDKSGNTRHIYFKIPKDQGQRIITALFEYPIRRMQGENVDIDYITKAAQEFIPYIPTQNMPPTFEAIIGYYANKDFWRNEDIWKGPEVERKEEYNNYTPQGYIKWGRLSGMSPKRSKYTVEQFLTSGNIWTSLVGAGFNQIFDDMPKSERNKVTQEIVTQSPFIRRIARSTKPYTEQQRGVDEARLKSQTESYKVTRKLDELAYQYFDSQEQSDKQKVLDFIKQQPRIKQRALLQRVRRNKRYYNIPDRRWWVNLSSLDPETRATVFYTRWSQVSADEKRKLTHYMKTLPGIRSQRFMYKLNKLRSQQ